jgi:hypothetical protein
MLAALTVVRTTLTPGVYTPVTPDALYFSRAARSTPMPLSTMLLTGRLHKALYLAMVAPIKSLASEFVPSYA